MYNVEISPTALKALEKLKKHNKDVCKRVTAVIDNLRENPYNGKKLLGELSGLRSLRVADYRIIYTVIEKRILVQVVKISHRREVYR